MSRQVSGKKIMITGGAGFIGSNLCDAMIAQGNQVICFDDLSTGFRHNIAHLEEEDNFNFVQGDICDFDALVANMSGVDLILHQAALGSVPRSIHDPRATNRVNVVGFLNVLEAAKASGIRRVVFASSSSVYGDTEDSPKVEDRLGRQLSPYAVSKYVNELYAHVFAQVYELDLIGLRYFNVFGRRQTPDGAYAAAIPKFIKALLSGDSPTIFGDGTQTRDFTYVDNVILANNLAATAPQEALNQMYNVACGEAITVNEVVNTLKAALGAKEERILAIEPEYLDPRIGDVLVSLASIDKGRDLLGYEPSVDFRSGISHAIDWYYRELK